MLLQVEVPREGDPALVLLPGTSSGGYTRMVADEAEKRGVLPLYGGIILRNYGR